MGEGASTIPKNCAVHNVTTPSLKTEMEAVTRALLWIDWRGDIQSTHAIILTDLTSHLQKSGKWTGRSRLACVNVRHSPSKTLVDALSWTCRGMTEQINWQRSNPYKWLASRKIWRAWYATFRNEAKDITPSITWRRGRERTIASQTNIGTGSKDEKGP